MLPYSLTSTSKSMLPGYSKTPRYADAQIDAMSMRRNYDDPSIFAYASSTSLASSNSGTITI